MFKLLKHIGDRWWAAVLGPLFAIAEVVFDVAIPYVMSLIIDVGITQRGGDIDYIIQMGIYMCLLALGGGISGALSGWLTSIAGARFVRNLRMRMYEKIQQFSFKNIEHFSVPSVVMRLTTDMRMMRMAVISIIRLLVRAPFNLLFSAYMVWRLNNTLAGIFAIAIPILATGLYIITMKAHPRFVKLMAGFDDMNADLQENIAGIRVVKTFVREKYEDEKFEKSSGGVKAAQRYAESLVILTDPFFQLVMYACMIAIAWFGGKFVIAGSLTTGAFISYLAYLRSILFSLLMVSNALMQIVMAQASVDRTNAVLNEKIDISDEQADSGLQLTDGSVEFKNVAFKYDENAAKMALEGVNLKINSGETIGILGPTGSSKSTMVQLIPRLYDVSVGQVLVSGHDVREYKLANLRQQVAMVLQKNELFSGTIEDNMKWGNPDADHQQVVEACRCAQADDFIMSFPKGYQTDLGQGGVNVSGGQKQRLCIARALLKQPKIIIMDDSTSAVDTDTDHRIQLALKQKLAGMTTIIIAQRVASVKEADRIVIMDNGTIADIGTHQQLLSRNAVYRDLYQTQMEGVDA